MAKPTTVGTLICTFAFASAVARSQSGRDDITNPKVVASIMNDAIESRKQFFSGRMHNAVASVVRFRKSSKGTKLRPDELDIRNYDISIVRGDVPAHGVEWLTEQERKACFVVELLPKYLSEPAVVDGPPRQLRSAWYSVRITDSTVTREEISK